jgi:hypothetical protein
MATWPFTRQMIIAARFPGTCRECGRRIHQGDRINWARGAGSTHLNCNEVGIDEGDHRCIGCGIDAGTMMMNASLGLSCPDCYDELSG